MGKKRKRRQTSKLDKKIARELLKQLQIENVLFDLNMELDAKRVERLREYIT